MNTEPANTVPDVSSVLADLAALGVATAAAETRLVGLGRQLRAASATAPVTTTALPSPGGVALRVLVAAAVLVFLI